MNGTDNKSVFSPSEADRFTDPRCFLAHAHLVAAGVENADQVLEEIYAEHIPDQDDYNAEAANFTEAYSSAMEKAEYVKLIRVMAGDDAAYYKELYDAGQTRQGRIDKGGLKYQAAIGRIPPYSPGGAEAYFERFKNLSDQVHDAAYDQALRMAKETLGKNPT